MEEVRWRSPVNEIIVVIFVPFSTPNAKVNITPKASERNHPKTLDAYAPIANTIHPKEI
jgi:hypothetical protein